MPQLSQLPSTTQRLEEGSGEGVRVVLLKNFPYGSEPDQQFFTDWVAVDSEFQNATLHVHCQTIAPTGLSSGIQIDLLTSFDTVEAPTVAGLSVTSTGSQSAAISANLGPMVKLEMSVAEAVPMFAVLSVWLQLKST